MRTDIYLYISHDFVDYISLLRIFFLKRMDTDYFYI